MGSGHEAGMHASGPGADAFRDIDQSSMDAAIARTMAARREEFLRISTENERRAASKRRRSSRLDPAAYEAHLSRRRAAGW